MLITRHTVAEQIAAYLRHERTLPELVDWAEIAILDGQFDEHDSQLVTNIVARLGVADVRAFGLTWDECETILRTLGYDARVEVVPT
jgi:hypothetical protein